MKLPKLCRNGDGRAYVEIPGTNRKREYFGVFGTDEAKHRYSSWLAVWLARPQSLMVESNTVLDVATAYLVDLRATVKKSTYSSNRTAIRHFVSFCGEKSVSTIGPKTLYDFLNYLEFVAHTDKKPITRRYCNVTLKRVTTFIRWASSREYMPSDTWSKVICVEPLKKKVGSKLLETSPIGEVEWDTVKNTLPYITDPFADICRIQFYCGMRPGEVLNLRHVDIDKSEPIWIIEPEEHKNSSRGKRLFKAVPLIAQKILNKYPQRNGNEYVFTSSTGLTFLNVRYDAQVRKAVDKAFEDKKIKVKWTPNQLRHGIATSLRTATDAETAQYYLGHATLKTTDVYAHRTKDKISSIANIVDKLFTSDEQTTDNL